ncbi:MAG: LysM peptidoglycan-binding domain-containing protein [Caldilineaceae bacterium]|nr:LysM peptidoglycan-binding domain-containing protein [Caldilineaceae bacterium]
MTTLANQGGRPFARDQLQRWGVLLLIVLLLLGLILFMALVLVPDVRKRIEYNGLLRSAETELTIAQKAKAEAPALAQARLNGAEQRLQEAAQVFLNESESSVVVNRLYAYAQAAGVEIINLQAAPAITTDTYAQRNFQFQVAGPIEPLLDFLGRIEEVELPGFVISGVNLVADQEQHLLNMKVSVYISPYSTRSVLMPDFEKIEALPLAEVQQQVEKAWLERDWGQAIRLLDHVVTTTPENEAARIALYRARVNYGYHYLAERNYAAARQQFELALTIQPNGREAVAELEQMAQDSALSHSVEDRLRQQVDQASASGNWQEVIRLLRIIGAVDPLYGPVDEKLNQAYIHYGDQLVAQGNSVAAEEQYQLANYSRPDQAQPADALPLSAAAALPFTATITPQLIAEAVNTPLPPSTPTPPPSATAIPSPTPPPTASPTPMPSSTPLPTATQPPAPTAAPTSTPAATATAIAVLLPTSTVPAAIPPPAAGGGAVTIPAQPLPPVTTYVVQRGDTLFSIARRYGTTVEALRAANGLNSNDIRAGQLLYIGSSAPQPPSPGTGTIVHTVVDNDTLYSLSRRYGTTVEAIMQANGLNSNRIYVGQRLTIPG